MADAIRSGGIADQKARRIQQILAAIREREGRIDLSRLNDLDDQAVEEYLTSLPGVGPKTAACVLVFSMGRAAFPIDTHVHRIAVRLGWIPRGPARNRRTVSSVPPCPPASGTTCTSRSSNTAVRSARRSIRGAGHVSCAADAPTLGNQAAN